MNPLFQLAEEEAARARTLFPKADHLVLAFAEEAGEVVKAALDAKQGKGSLDGLRKELVQCAAMLLRLAEEGDPTLGLPPVKEQLLSALYLREAVPGKQSKPLDRSTP